MQQAEKKSIRTAEIQYGHRDAARALFAIRPGLPATEALDTALCYVNAVKRALEGLAESNSALWPLTYTLENAEALIQASAEGINGATRS